MIHARKDYNRIQDPKHLIPKDEPVFLIRGKDVCAPATLEFWAKLAENAGADKNIVEAAREHANQMRMWQAENEFKVPDMP